jgi:hypothetical protein
VNHKYKDVRYSDLSFRFPIVLVEFPIILVRFRTPAYSDSVSEPVFSEPGGRNGGFSSVSSRFVRGHFPAVRGHLLVATVATFQATVAKSQAQASGTTSQ